MGMYLHRRYRHVFLSGMFPLQQAIDWCQDLLVDPSTRDNTDIQHKLVAIGSRSTESANKFIEKLKALEEPYSWGVKNGVMDEVKGYGSYDEVYNASVSYPFLSLLYGQSE
jgi:hypothetical protein